MAKLGPKSLVADVSEERLLPLVVDVDGTLLRTDLLEEAALQFVARRPLEAARIPVWLLEGKAVLKARLADRVEPGIGAVPLCAEVVNLIRAAQADDRPVYLASASDHRYVQALAERIGGLAGIFATQDGVNLAGAAKARQLVAAFGAGGFDYVGDSNADMAVWRVARRVLVVSHGAGFARRVKREFPDAEFVANPRPAPRAYVKALRPHQWAKNSLLFLSMIAGHHFDLKTIVAAVLAFVCFCAAASSAYIINDLLDLPGDRDHPRKSKRPFAAGAIPIKHGVALSLALMMLSIGVSLALPLRFDLVLAAYVVTTLAYSLALKRLVVLDVVTLGGLYTLRVFAGLAATSTSQSQWLLMFSLFLFLSLALVKRCSELVLRRDEGKTTTPGRGYRTADLGVLLPLAAAAGYGAVFVVALYMSSAEVAALYRRPHLLWLVCPPLIYWISRVLVLANRGELHDDPVVFAITDRVSWVTGAVVAGVIAVSI
jgi:4-hydroxybenzoate polyprenyltransferase